MKKPSSPGGSSPPLYQQMVAAFNKPPDDAGILQGVRPFRNGLVYARLVLTPSPKNGQHFIPCEGRLESAMALALEIDPDVAAFRTQPFPIPGKGPTPLVCDFAVKFTDGSYCVIDVKPSGELTRESVQERNSRVRRILSDAGIPHKSFTEKELYAEPGYSIRDQLRRGANIQLSAHDRQRLLAALGDRRISVRELRADAKRLGLSPFSVEKLALLGDLTFPINAPLREPTLIGATHGTDHSAAGDTIEVHGKRIRFKGIDAPESQQLCQRDDKPWRCGADAANALDAFLDRRTVSCERLGKDRYKRIVARCTVGGEDLNTWMVRNGWALDYERYSGGEYRPAPAVACQEC